MSRTSFSAGDLKVVVDRPARRWLIFGLLIALIAATLTGGYFLGRALRSLDTTYVTSLERINSANTERLAELNRQLIDTRLAYEVDSQALTALRTDLMDTRAQMAKLREEVTFYRSLMDPKSVAKGLQIAAFETLPLASGSSSYHLLLTQVASRRSWLSGTVQIEVAGQGPGGPQVLPLTDLASIEDYPLKFRFRYFQDLRGELKLPADFEPRSVEVTVQRSGKKPLRRSFPWAADA